MFYTGIAGIIAWMLLTSFFISGKFSPISIPSKNYIDFLFCRQAILYNVGLWFYGQNMLAINFIGNQFYRSS
jgi:hypothetical protein